MVSAAGSFEKGMKPFSPDYVIKFMYMILVRSLWSLHNVDELFTQNLSAILCKIVLNPGAIELQIIVINLQYNYLFFHQLIHIEKPVTILLV